MGWPARVLFWSTILLTVLLTPVGFIADYPWAWFKLQMVLEPILLIPFWLVLCVIAAPFRRRG